VPILFLYCIDNAILAAHFGSVIEQTDEWRQPTPYPRVPFLKCLARTFDGSGARYLVAGTTRREAISAPEQFDQEHKSKIPLMILRSARRPRAGLKSWDMSYGKLNS
jgi:hypothetical protein